MQGDLVSSKEGAPGTEPRRSRLRQILDEQPQARARVGRAVAVLLGTSLVALAAIGALVIWHLIRRGRLIRERLNPPRKVSLLEIPADDDDPPS
ncbi:MAG: hypothetical protein ACLQIB_25155 [Isosphaeraceae bacterium]